MAHPSYKRAERVGDLLREELSFLLLYKVRDPRIGTLTITRVTVSDDLHMARVYVAAPADQEARKRVLEGLESAAPYLRGELGKRLYLRRIPKLSFLADDSLEYSLHIHALLRGLKEGQEDE